MNYKKFIKNLNKVKLDENEKKEMNNEIISFLADNPERKSFGFRHLLTGGYLSLRQKNIMTKRLVLPVLAVLIIASGGTALAAEGSLPGDALYPVKTNVNEQLRVRLAVSDMARANQMAAIAEKRLEETEVLISREDVSEEVVGRLEIRFATQIENMQAVVAKLEANGEQEAADQVRTRIQASMEIHEQILNNLQEKISNGELIGPGLGQIMNQVNQTRQEMHTERQEYREQVLSGEITIEAAKNRREAAIKMISNTESFIEKMKSRISEENYEDALDNLEESRDLVAEGDIELEAGNYSEAFSKYQEAHHQAVKSKTYFKSQRQMSKGNILNQNNNDLDDSEEDNNDKNDNE